VDTERVGVHAIQTTRRGANVNMSGPLQIAPRRQTSFEDASAPGLGQYS